MSMIKRHNLRAQKTAMLTHAHTLLRIDIDIGRSALPDLSEMTGGAGKAAAQPSPLAQPKARGYPAIESRAGRGGAGRRVMHDTGPSGMHGLRYRIRTYFDPKNGFSLYSTVVYWLFRLLS